MSPSAASLAKADVGEVVDAMARFTTTIKSPWSAEDAFTYLADFRNFATWDPSVSSSTMVSGTEPGVGTIYAVTVKGATLEYVTQEHVPSVRAVVEGASSLFHSYDVVEITPTSAGCDVTYDARLKLRGPASIFNPVLPLFFDRLGKPAADGLAKALDGSKVA